MLHRREEALSCHHCDHREPVPVRCECGSSSIARHGMGTERLHDELLAIVGGEHFPVFRLDADLVAPPATVLQRFERASAGLLLGTQMVAKGHDFPDVTLGVVLDADASLSFPDFRAEERTFALLAQLAGRVGRGASGHVLVQTLVPDARAIRHAARHDSEGFLDAELERRRALSYPPFSHLIRVVCAAPEGARAAAAARALADRLRERLSDPRTSVLGPASLFRLRGRERRALLLKAADRTATVRALDEALRELVAARAHTGVSLGVDVEPQ